MENRCSCCHDAWLGSEDEQTLTGWDANRLTRLRDDRRAAGENARRADHPLGAHAWWAWHA
jgi:hypothetical protein